MSHTALALHKIQQERDRELFKIQHERDGELLKIQQEERMMEGGRERERGREGGCLYGLV